MKSRYLFRLLRRHPRLDLPQTLTNEQDPIDQQPVRRTLDFEIPEKRIGPKQRQYLIKGVVGFAVGVNVDVRG